MSWSKYVFKPFYVVGLKQISLQSNLIESQPYKDTANFCQSLTDYLCDITVPFYSLSVTFHFNNISTWLNCLNNLVPKFLKYREQQTFPGACLILGFDRYMIEKVIDQKY